MQSSLAAGHAQRKLVRKGPRKFVWVNWHPLHEKSELSAPGILNIRQEITALPGGWTARARTTIQPPGPS